MTIPFKPTNICDFEPIARQKMRHDHFEYYVGGSDDEITLRENRDAFGRILLRPRMLRDSSNRDLSVTVLGQKFDLPFMVAPMALAKLAHPQGESAVARAAKSRGVGVVLSTISTIPLEEIAEIRPNPLWFQLYVYKDRAITRDLVSRAQESGYGALVVTVDTPYLGKRERDMRNPLQIPEEYVVANLRKPDAPRMGEARPDTGLNTVIARYDDSLTWKDMEWLASITNMPVLVKGVLRGDDAKLAVEHGMKGVVVSNHGGRQLDTAIATISALPDVVAGVDGKADVLLDGGVRRGTDILKALALGAKAVLVGRPIYFALAAGGETGVLQAFDLLRDEFDLALALCGVHRADNIPHDILAI
ncbi:MAG: alpha-hydroxy-acid oxidizing protein [Anaerolineae bacterium]|nr:alpha-hydroxy-acid oxidizing protein [Anaerolineae bacterium]